jgi:hypothetical protein
MRRILYAGAGVAAAAAILLAVLPFGVGSEPGPSDYLPNGELFEGFNDSTRCSAPVRQVFAVPDQRVELAGSPDGRHITYTNRQPACKDVGRSRLATSGALLVSAALALALARRTPVRSAVPAEPPRDGRPAVGGGGRPPGAV